MNINPQHYHLLWFRPQSPLRYALPTALQALPWRSTLHLSIDDLQPCALHHNEKIVLQQAAIWILSSPTAAHIAASWGAPKVLAVMGKPSQSAWQQAGGKEPATWIVSSTGESMGLAQDLTQLAQSTHEHIAILRGNTGRNDLIEALRQQAIDITVVPAYRKQDLTHTAAFIQPLHDALNTKKTVALCFTSTDQPSRILAVCVPDMMAYVFNCPVWVTHERIFQAALKAGFKTVYLI